MQNTVISSDVFTHIIRYLDSHKDVLNICTLNKDTYRNIYQNNKYWKYMIEIFFPYMYNNMNKPQRCKWNRLYIWILKSKGLVLSSGNEKRKFDHIRFTYCIYLPSGRYIEYSSKTGDYLSEYVSYGDFEKYPYVDKKGIYNLIPNLSVPHTKGYIPTEMLLKRGCTIYKPAILNAIKMRDKYTYTRSTSEILEFLQAINDKDNTLNSFIDELYDMINQKKDRIYHRDEEEYTRENFKDPREDIDYHDGYSDYSDGPESDPYESFYDC